MGRPVSQHALLLLLQCVLVLRPGAVAGRRGPVLLPESPCHKTEHPVIPHSGQRSHKHTHTDFLFFLIRLINFSISSHNYINSAAVRDYFAPFSRGAERVSALQSGV